jgi:hypothetical protein
MRPSVLISRTSIKVLISVVVLCGLFAVVGRDLAPGIPTATWLLYCALAALSLLGALIVFATAALTFRQFILRNGATDVQWFWFSSEPKGLVKLRQERLDQEREDGTKGAST